MGQSPLPVRGQSIYDGAIRLRGSGWFGIKKIWGEDPGLFSFQAGRGNHTPPGGGTGGKLGVEDPGRREDFILRTPSPAEEPELELALASLPDPERPAAAGCGVKRAWAGGNPAVLGGFDILQSLQEAINRDDYAIRREAGVFPLPPWREQHAEKRIGRQSRVENQEADRPDPF